MLGPGYADGYTRPPMDPRTVLVIDDDSSLRLLCRVNLELDGYRVLEAATLAEARRALPKADVVLLDVHVGSDDGLAFVEEARAARQGVGVALLTGESDLERDHGADAVIGKPFGIDELRETVQRIGSSR
jgi:two-component system, OmpR family, KDP operon response regulator KdpE